jgi:hydrogenase maturation factor
VIPHRDRCITCSDSAVEATVVAVNEQTATVDLDGRREQVGLELVDNVAAGDVLLCHAGIALERIGGR